MNRWEIRCEVQLGESLNSEQVLEYAAIAIRTYFTHCDKVSITGLPDGYQSYIDSGQQ